MPPRITQSQWAEPLENTQRPDRRNAPWLKGAESSLVASFAKGVVKDKSAVSAAITSHWSNGQTEGQITKLKLVKRQIYGRESSISSRRASAVLDSPNTIKIEAEPLFHAETHFYGVTLGHANVPQAAERIMVAITWRAPETGFQGEGGQICLHHHAVMNKDD